MHNRISSLHRYVACARNLKRIHYRGPAMKRERERESEEKESMNEMCVRNMRKCIVLHCNVNDSY